MQSPTCGLVPMGLAHSGMADRPELSATSHAVLGMVAIRPASGYDLVAFADRSIAYFWSIPRSQLYRELARLEGFGLIAGVRVPQTAAPDKRVFEITAAGRTALVAWLESPIVPTGRSKHDLLLRVFMARHARPEALEPVLRRYRESVELELADLQAIVDQLADRPAGRFGRLTARWGVVHAEANLAWLDEAEALVATERELAAGDDSHTVRTEISP
jgi:PadR family transcriptional regulator, regulatory protein AphA